MKLCDPDLDRQLRAGVDRYDQLPSWMKEATSDREVTPSLQAGELEEQVQTVQEEG
jgi:hypothetical protein